ncbi:DNA adenine methylase [Ignavigranum ruoffiae]|uniref:site-specific DNA-methyltransferase (adenine-specific) n=1 Tax=Ignavigranum ruoffiae TaxID=89093 RepID=A0A1H9FDI0_9LACT|nr:DNA adenine methylase [Ignavigranum ruoffiae]SEQ35513.1 adenine-specific DNA-methyltransferase [Ignavigranum ruoffiae]
MGKYPKVNYIGNKQKLADWVIDKLPLDNGTVLDIFSGGNSISYFLKERGFKVISNDALYASFVLSKAFIENNSITLSLNELNEAREISIPFNIRKRYDWLENDLFFPEEVDELVKFVVYSEKMEEYKKYLFQALIRRAMIRKLPYSRMNINWDNIIKLRDEDYSYKKYGRKRAYHNKSFYHLMIDDFNSYNSAVFDNGKKNQSFQEDGIKIVRKIKEVDIIYVDPPYPGTMNNYEGFYGKFDRIFNKNIDYLDWTKKNSFMKMLNLLLSEAKNKTRYLILSINSNTVPSYLEVIKIFESYGNVLVYEKKHNYQVSGKINKNDNYEILIVLEYN